MIISELKKNYHSQISLDELDLILGFILKKNRAFILAHGEHQIKTQQLIKIKTWIKKRNQDYPLAYLMGVKEFYGLTFKVNPNVLIPRPETEILVEKALTLANTNNHKKTIIDVGTGSGCIIISLAKSLPNNYQFFGIDVSAPALAVARSNAKLNQVDHKIKFLKSNLLESIKNYKLKIKNSELIITANLPYLTPAQIKKSPSIKKEPRLALVAGADGLKYYKILLTQISKLPQKNITLLMEIDPGQTKALKEICSRLLPDHELTFKQDLCGRDRIAILENSKMQSASRRNKRQKNF